MNRTEISLVPSLQISLPTIEYHWSSWRFIPGSSISLCLNWVVLLFFGGVGLAFFTNYFPLGFKELNLWRPTRFAVLLFPHRCYVYSMWRFSNNLVLALQPTFSWGSFEFWYSAFHLWISDCYQLLYFLLEMTGWVILSPSYYYHLRCSYNIFT